MKIKVLFVLTFAMLAVSACVVDPYGGGYGGGYRGGHGGYYSNDGYNQQHDYGRRVWRQGNQGRD